MLYNIMLNFVLFLLWFLSFWYLLLKIQTLLVYMKTTRKKSILKFVLSDFV